MNPYRQKQKDAYRRIEKQLRAGYLNLIDSQHGDEIHIIREAVKEYKSNHFTKKEDNVNENNNNDS